MNIQEFLTELQEELEFEDKLELNTNIKEVEDWDSLAAMILIGYISDNFDITINADDIEKFTTIESIVVKIGKEKFE